MDSDTEGFSEAGAAVNDFLSMKIREVRQARHMSQESLADAMKSRGFPWYQATVAKIESGRRPLRADELAAVASALGIPAGDLLPGASESADPAGLERALRERIAAEILSGARRAAS